MSFDKRLQQALNDKKMSQSELGRLVDASSQTVNAWCNSNAFPRKDKLDLLPQILGKPLYWFFMSEQEEKDFLAVTESKTVLNSKQNQLLEAFNQLPESEQSKFIDMAKARLDELDSFMHEYLQRRKITPP